jgi:hypothetical protein
MVKNKNAYPPPIVERAIGNTNVIIVLKNQCEKEPIADPLARISVGNISERRTHITVPCDKANSAIKPSTDIKIRGILALPEMSAHANNPRKTGIPIPPI